MSTSLLDPILFNIRSLRVFSLGITEVAGPLFLLDNAIFERHTLRKPGWVMSRRSSEVTRPIAPADVLRRLGVWPRFYVSMSKM